MATIRGLLANVFFGNPDTKEPSWKDLPTTQDEDQDDDPKVSPDELARKRRMLGFTLED